MVGVERRAAIVEVPGQQGQFVRLVRMNIGRCLSVGLRTAILLSMAHDCADYVDRGTLLTCDEVARALHVSRRTVAKLAAEGDLPRVKIGRAARFRPRDVEALIDKGLKHDEDPAGKPGLVTTPVGGADRHGHPTR